MAYDAESRVTKVDAGTTATYVYDANGQRVEKTTSSGTIDYLYDLGGRQITEISSSGGWNRGEVYAGGRHLATYANSTTYFIHPDWLGTERARSNVRGVLCETITSLPFGDGQSTSGSCSDTSPMHFTGKPRDTESNLDYFGARYYTSQLGRFMSPDPKHVWAHLSDAQTFNRYAYTRNNPLFYIDPNGKDLSLAPGLTPAQVAKAVAILAEQFQKPNQRAIIIQAAQSPVNNTVSTAPIPQPPGPLSPGDNTPTVGFTNGKPDPAKTTNDIHIDPKLSNLYTTVDWVAKHELSLTKDINQNLAGFVEDENNSRKTGKESKSEQDAQAAADAEDPIPDMPLGIAESAVQFLLGLPIENPIALPQQTGPAPPSDGGNPPEEN